MKKLNLFEAKIMMKKNNGYLNLGNSDIAELPDNLIVAGSLDLKNTQITALPKGLMVGGSIDLRGVPITALPDNLTVGDSINIVGTKIKSLPNNLTVGGSIYLCEEQIKTIPDDLTVGESIFVFEDQEKLSDNKIETDFLNPVVLQVINKNKYKSLKQGDYVSDRYLYANGILTHVKSRKEIKGYIFYEGKIKGRNVISDNENYAPCRTFKEGVNLLLK